MQRARLRKASQMGQYCRQGWIDLGPKANFNQQSQECPTRPFDENL
jgi:hypothetical protein